MTNTHKYTKRPVTIEARQLTTESFDSIIRWIHSYLGEQFASTIQRGKDPGSLTLPTLEGVMVARLGDYIIRGVQDEFYPCKPEIFEQTYSPATAKPRRDKNGMYTSSEEVLNEYLRIDQIVDRLHRRVDFYKELHEYEIELSRVNHYSDPTEKEIRLKALVDQITQQIDTLIEYQDSLSAALSERTVLLKGLYAEGVVKL